MGAREDWWGDPGDDLELRPERGRRGRSGSRRRQTPSTGDHVASVLLLGASVLIAPVTWFAVVLSEMAFAACADPRTTCHEGAGDAVLVWHPTALFAVLVVGVLSSVRRRLHGRPAWQTALGTLLGVGLVFLAAVVTVQVATDGHLW